MQKIFNLQINALDLGQLLDGLEIRATAWRNTADYLRTGTFSGEPFIAEECSDPEEAEKICRHYESIAANLQAQIDEQGGW